MAQINAEGPDLSALFPKPPKPLTKEQVKPLLPALFNDRCKGKGCGRTMDLMPAAYSTRRRPFATYQCPSCKLRLLLFTAPVTPLLVWSDEFVNQTNFSDFVDRQLAQREHKREVRAVRYGLWGHVLRFVRSLAKDRLP